MNKTRESNFELMRITSMLFIIIYHCLVSTGGQLINHSSGLTKIFFELLSMIIIVHVNSFILISGYFQYDKKIKFSKVKKLIGMELFYSIVIILIFYILGKEKFIFLDFIRIISPFEFQNQWFLITYIALYLLSPYINLLIKNLNQKQHKQIIVQLVIMYSVIPYITNQATFSNTGFSLIHFIILYIIGSYLKKYPVSENYHFKNYSNKKKITIFFTIFITFGVLTFLLYNFSQSILQKHPGNFITYIFNSISASSYYYSNPIIIIQSIAYFLIFECLKFKNKIVNYISSSVFSIYVITENPYILKRLYYWIGINTKDGTIFNGFGIVFKIFAWSLIIFIVCILIESIRKELLKVFSKTYKKIKEKYKKEKIITYEE